MAWLLADIASAVAPRTSVTTGVTPADAKLSELPDEELTHLSHNRLPEYKAIMDEIEKRKARC